MQMPNNVAGRRPARGRQRSTLAGSCRSGRSTELSAPKSEGSGRRESTTPLPDQSPAIARIATVRFAHHYAVVASTLAEPDNPWHGVPVFAAWVTQPDDADRDH